MKIGILTLPLYTNYGGILQAYALQTVLERMGHEVYEIEKKIVYKQIKIPYYKYPIVLLKRLIKKYLLGDKNMLLFPEKEYNRKILPNLWKITQYTDDFIKKHINRVLLDDYAESIRLNLDAIVVGSDQVWRPKYILGSLYDAYLDFAISLDIRKISYAASFGVDEWEYDNIMTRKCSELLSHFDAVSVREDSAIDLCAKHLNRKDVIKVVDPTLLLDADDYMKLFINENIKSEGNLMVYILDKTEEIIDNIYKFAEVNGFEPFQTNSNVENGKASIEDRIQPPLEPWLRGFYDAEFIITDSFHACVFSIIFRKPFLVINNTKRGNARLLSLLKPLGLEDRIIENIMSSNYAGKAIDYDRVHEKINEQKTLSFNYLKVNLV